MKLKYFIFFHVLLLVILNIGCASNKARVKAYQNPTLNSIKINSVGILPLRNSFTQRSSLNTGEMIEINRLFQSEFIKLNSNTKVIDAATYLELLNKSNLVNKYDDLLRIYDNTGIPNTISLKEIGQETGVDAIIQGFVFNLLQNDGSYGRNRGETSLDIKYVMFSTTTGEVLWDAIYSGYKGTALTTQNAPPIDDVLRTIKKKIPNSIPKLSVK